MERDICKYAVVIGCKLQWVSDGSQRYFDVYNVKGITQDFVPPTPNYNTK